MALHTQEGANVAALAMQPLEELAPVRLWNDDPPAERQEILEQVGGLKGLLERGLGESFQLKKPSSNRKGGLKDAIEMLCIARLCYKVYDNFSHASEASTEVGLRMMTWCPDEIFLHFPRAAAVPKGHVRCQVRLSPTSELLRIARDNA